APPLICVLPAASVVRLVSALIPPTAPPKVVIPLALTVRFEAGEAAASASRVLAKVTFVPVSVVFVLIVTVSLYAWSPVVLTTPPLICVLPAASVVRLGSAWIPPTTPAKVVVPLGSAVRRGA